MTTTTRKIVMMMMMMFAVLASGEEKPRKVCLGTNSGKSFTTKPTSTRINNYRERYENCTVVNGNLEIVHLNTNGHVDLSFLQDIQEVTGYVLIFTNTMINLHLNSLRIIRGMTLINCGMTFPDQDSNCSLVVTNNYHLNDHKYALTHLGMSSLQDILAGNVYISNNMKLCTYNINWADIFSNDNLKAFQNNNNNQCTECHETCAVNGVRYCWGEGSDMCQKLTKKICSPQCDNRCSGPDPGSCCHKECSVGCNGPLKSDCLACRHYENEGKCESNCPPITIYNPKTFKQELNPDGRYTYGAMCLKKCPAHLTTDDGFCVRQCSGEKYVINGTCVPCQGACPKSCPGTLEMGLTSNNLENFKGCKIVHGNLHILGTGFMLDDEHQIPPLSLDDLNILETIEEITGSLSIQLTEFTNLTFLRNLKVIRGIELTDDLKSLRIVSTGLTSIDLTSLSEISHGNILISRNAKMCFVDSVDWRHLLKDTESAVVVKDNNINCGGLTCSNQCSDLGCWGPEDTDCLSCRNFRFLGQCLESCAMNPPAYEMDEHTCERCHHECMESCTGKNASHCKSCRNVKDDQTCVPQCPRGKYPDPYQTCRHCHVNCGNHGCTGPLNTVDDGGCESCDLVLFGDLSDKSKVTECLDPKLTHCEEGYFKIGLHDFPDNHALYLKYGCKQCHLECITCEEYGTNYCGQCRNYRQEDKCVPSCSSGFYPSNVIGSPNKRSTNIVDQDSISRSNKMAEATCLPCDSTCLTCYGPKSSECYTCRNYVVFHDEAHPDKGFNCTSKCPDMTPFKVTKDHNGTKITECVSEDGHGTQPWVKVVVPVVIVVVVALAVVILAIVIFNFKKARNKSKVLTAAANLLVGKQVPITPSGIAGDSSRVGTISEKDLRLGEKIGSGAFGSVYKGIWSPPSVNCRIYVAIKVAHNCFGQQNQEALDEIRIMSSVVNEHCIRILGFCMAKRIMIITQLMPYGSMLDFIQENNENIGSKVLLNWAMQIAKGMAYLGTKDIVHRDLAARNVLVQNDNQVRITDFGLSKILHGLNCYKSEGGKLPIKWLALESLQYKYFTHKSDVWSYGVTIWEMFTFGKKPYEHVEPCNMVDFLEKGDRLVQPSICTIDVYMVMIKCWVPNAEDRPSFQQLEETFTIMARDPARFLVIKNDECKELKSTETITMLRQISTIDNDKPVIGADEYFQRSDERNRGQQEVMTSFKGSPGPSTRVEMGDPSQAVAIGWSHKKANGHAHWTSKNIHRESPKDLGRYIDDPCDNTDQRLMNRPRNLPSSIPENPSSSWPTPPTHDDYLEPKDSPNTPNGYPGPKSPQGRSTQAFSNPQYFDLPLPNLAPPTDNVKSQSFANHGPNVLFDNRKGAEPSISLVRQESETTNDDFEDDSGPASQLLGFVNDNNNEYYNYSKSNKKSKKNSELFSGVL